MHPATAKHMKTCLLEGDEVEERIPNALSKVRTPTDAEREAHHLSGHATYRNWCEHCVQAKGEGNPHLLQVGNPSELPEVAVDYMYLGDDTSSEVLPNIVGKDRRTGCFCGSTVESKGRNQYAMT